jgi:hypothetical protein
MALFFPFVFLSFRSMPGSALTCSRSRSLPTSTSTSTSTATRPYADLDLDLTLIRPRLDPASAALQTRKPYLTPPAFRPTPPHLDPLAPCLASSRITNLHGPTYGNFDLDAPRPARCSLLRQTATTPTMHYVFYLLPPLDRPPSSSLNPNTIVLQTTHADSTSKPHPYLT